MGIEERRRRKKNRNKKKKFSLLALGFILAIVAVIVFVIIIPSKGTAPLAEENKPLSGIKISKIEDVNDEYTVTAFYPQTENQDVNNSIKEDLQNRIDIFKNNIKNKTFFNVNEFFSTFEMSYYENNKSIVSIKYNTKSTHKKRFNKSTETFNINIDTGRIYTYPEIFDKEGYEDLLPDSLKKPELFMIDKTDLVFVGEEQEKRVALESLEDYIIGDLGGGFSDEELNEMKLVAMTFDDGPHGTLTLQLLDILDKEEVKATFYLLGANVKNFPDVAKEIHDRGHQIGSHTYDHKVLSSLSMDNLQYEINETVKVIEDATGEKPSTMRPPYGAYNDNVRAQVHAPIILWSVDTLDWKTKNPASINQVTMNTVSDGAIILLHDIHATTVEAVPTLIKNLKNQGYYFVTVDDLIRVRGERVDGDVYNSLPR